MANKIGPGQIVGIGFSFGVTMAVSILIMYVVGNWIDEKLGLNGVFAFIGILLGIFSGFRLLLESIRSLERPRGREYDAWKEEQVQKEKALEEKQAAEKAAKKQQKLEKRQQKKQKNNKI